MSFDAPPNDGLITVGQPEPSGLADRAHLGGLGGKTVAKAYWEKLKDPRWQKKRLGALQDSDFHCQMCGDGTSTLHVHHKQYFKGREPWEYDVKQLAVLCEDCHSAHHEEEDDLDLVGSYLDIDGPYSRSTAASLLLGFARVLQPTISLDFFAYYAGVLADNLFTRYGKKIDDIAALAELSDTNAAGMYEALIQYAKSVKETSKQ